jgi:glycosyltransferase involved in cell wall biosynthesis
MTGRRVLHVLASNDRRGAEVFASELAEALAPLGHRSTLVSLRRSTYSATVPATPIEASSRVGVHRSLRRLARQHDVVIAHGSRSLPACALACAGAAPFVYRSIGDPAYWSDSRAKRVRTKLLLDRTEAVVCLFEAAREVLARRGVRSQLELIPNAVRANEFAFATTEDRLEARRQLGVPPDATVALYLGALSREKRPERCVTLAAARPELSVHVVGDGPMRPDIEAAAATVDNVVVHGPTSTPRRYLQAADVMIVPSDTEGIPGVAIEAGLTGVPTVASNVGGLGELIDDGVTGFLVAAGDDWALAEAVDRAVAQRDELGPAARARCLERFDMAVVAQSWARLIDRAARPRTGT